jgi:polysaccharide deacetylase family protein (PEP-CTERM system associated)
MKHEAVCQNEAIHLLTFDVEEWFHILDNESTKGASQWSSFESRIHRNMECITEMLQEHGQRATFFCLGWIARKYPEVIRNLVRAGYEIGSHGDMHQLVYEQGPALFRKDLDASVKVLEDITGEKIRYYRAPGFSIRENDLWAFEILAESGIEFDCSIFPAPRAHGGFPSYRAPVPSILSYHGHKLRELPMSYASIAGRSLVFSGGGYFRIAPYGRIRKWTAGSGYVMSYLHPRDFDVAQPKIDGLSLFRTFKSYVGLSGALGKLERWISEFRFVDIGTAVDLVDWELAPVVELG